MDRMRALEGHLLRARGKLQAFVRSCPMPPNGAGRPAPQPPFVPLTTTTRKPELASGITRRLTRPIIRSTAGSMSGGLSSRDV
jgi:hypothetical protein